MAERLPLFAPTYVGDSIYLAKTAPEVKVNQSPQFEPVAPITMLHTETRRVPIVVSDPDQHSVTLSVSSPRPGIYIDGFDLVIEGSMANAGYGAFTVTVTGTDELGATNSLDIILTIDVYTTPPVVEALPDLTLAVGESMTLLVDAVDPEAHEMSYRMTGQPEGSGLSAEGPLLRLAPNALDLAASPITLTVRVTDQWAAWTEEHFTLTVVEASTLANPPSPLLSGLIQPLIQPAIW